MKAALCCKCVVSPPLCRKRVTMIIVEFVLYQTDSVRRARITTITETFLYQTDSVRMARITTITVKLFIPNRFCKNGQNYHDNCETFYYQTYSVRMARITTITVKLFIIKHIL